MGGMATPFSAKEERKLEAIPSNLYVKGQSYIIVKKLQSDIDISEKAAYNNNNRQIPASKVVRFRSRGW